MFAEGQATEKTWLWKCVTAQMEDDSEIFSVNTIEHSQGLHENIQQENAASKSDPHFPRETKRVHKSKQSYTGVPLLTEDKHRR